MKKLFMGHSPVTTIAGYLLAALMTVQDLQRHGIYNWKQCILPLSIAILGRLAGDDHPPIRDGRTPLNISSDTKSEEDGSGK